MVSHLLLINVFAGRNGAGPAAFAVIMIVEIFIPETQSVDPLRDQFVDALLDEL